MRILTAVILAALLASSNAAAARSASQNETPIRFGTWNAVTAAMKDCGGVETEFSQVFQERGAAGFSADPSLCHSGGVANAAPFPRLSADVGARSTDVQRQLQQGKIAMANLRASRAGAVEGLDQDMAAADTIAAFLSGATDAAETLAAIESDDRVAAGVLA